MKKNLKYIVLGLMFALFSNLHAAAWPAYTQSTWKNEWRVDEGTGLWHQDHRVQVTWNMIDNGTIYRAAGETINSGTTSYVKLNIDVYTVKVATSIAGLRLTTDFYVSFQKTTDSTYVSNPWYTFSSPSALSVTEMTDTGGGTRGTGSGVSINSVNYSTMRWTGNYVKANATNSGLPGASWQAAGTININGSTPDGSYRVCLRARGINYALDGIRLDLNDPASGWFVANPGTGSVDRTGLNFFADNPTTNATGQCRNINIRSYFTVTNPGDIIFGSSTSPIYIDETKASNTYAAIKVVNYTLTGAFDSTISVNIAGTTAGTISLTGGLNVRVGLGPIAGATTSNLGTTSLTNYSFPGNNYTTTNDTMTIPVIYAIPNGQRPTNGEHTGNVTITLSTN